MLQKIIVTFFLLCCSSKTDSADSNFNQIKNQLVGASNSWSEWIDYAKYNNRWNELFGYTRRWWPSWNIDTAFGSTIRLAQETDRMTIVSNVAIRKIIPFIERLDKNQRNIFDNINEFKNEMIESIKGTNRNVSLLQNEVNVNGNLCQKSIRSLYNLTNERKELNHMSVSIQTMDSDLRREINNLRSFVASKVVENITTELHSALYEHDSFLDSPSAMIVSIVGALLINNVIVIIVIYFVVNRSTTRMYNNLLSDTESISTGKGCESTTCLGSINHPDDGFAVYEAVQLEAPKSQSTKVSKSMVEMKNVSSCDLYAIPYSDSHATAKELSTPMTTESKDQLVTYVQIANGRIDSCQEVTVESADSLSAD